MTRKPDLAFKSRLLDEVVDHLARNGLADFTLRPLAKAIGVSTTALVYHLGTREEILRAALQRSADQQVAIRAAWLAAEPGLSQSDLLRKWWAWMNESADNLSIMRLGLEAAALEGTTTGLADDIRAAQIGQWRTNIEERLLDNGVAQPRAELAATIVKALYTGLVLDLIATGERERLTTALEVALDRLDAFLAEVTLDD